MLKTVSFSVVTLAAVAAAGLLSTAGTASAQSLGSMARRLRDERREMPRRALHVYTNSDFKRQEILTPADRARADRVQADPLAKDLQAAKAARASSSASVQIPLGDVARHYRWLKEIEKEQALNPEDILPTRQQAVASPRFTRPRLPAAPAQSRSSGQGLNRVPPDSTRIQVERGDSLWKIAARRLGDGARWREILALNPRITNPNLIRPGQWLQLPQAVASSSSLTGRAGLTRVNRGDTLWSIAQLRFGNGRAWGCIARHNPQLHNPNFIVPGQKLTLPQRCDDVR